MVCTRIWSLWKRGGWGTSEALAPLNNYLNLVLKSLFKSKGFHKQPVQLIKRIVEPCDFFIFYYKYSRTNLLMSNLSMTIVDFWNVIIKIKRFQLYCANQTKTTFGKKCVSTFYYFYRNMGKIPLQGAKLKLFSKEIY